MGLFFFEDVSLDVCYYYFKEFGWIRGESVRGRGLKLEVSPTQTKLRHDGGGGGGELESRGM
jgi:hypothetical protein